MSSIAIIGAGSSGLAAAHTFRDAGYHVTIFEKSHGVGGRAATRRREGFVYDHGAQYIKDANSADAISNKLITERFRTTDLIDIGKPVWTFDHTGYIQEGDPQQNAEPKWSYRNGLTSLAKRMAEGLNIHFHTHVDLLQQTHEGWALFDSDGLALGEFTHLLITIPIPQALALIEHSLFVDTIQTPIKQVLGVARYNPLLSVMLGYRPTPRKRPYYALVNTDKAHPISWLAWEHEKAPERTPQGTGLLIAQMAPHYSKDHWKLPDEQAVLRDVASLVATLLDEALPPPMFTDMQHWLYALPSDKANADAVNQLTLPHGLAFCGDGFVGGRVHLALEHGVRVAQQLIGMERN